MVCKSFSFLTWVVGYHMIQLLLPSVTYALGSSPIQCLPPLKWDNARSACVCDSGLNSYEPFFNNTCCPGRFQEPFSEKDPSSCMCPKPLRQIQDKCLCHDTAPKVRYYEPAANGQCGSKYCDISGQVQNNEGMCVCPEGTSLVNKSGVKECRSEKCRSDQIAIPYLNICACNKGMTLENGICIPDCNLREVPNSDYTGCECIEGAFPRIDGLGCDCMDGLTFDEVNMICARQANDLMFSDFLCPTGAVLVPTGNSRRCVCHKNLEWDEHQNTCACKSVAGFYKPFKNGNCCRSVFMHPQQPDDMDSCTCVPPLLIHGYDCTCKSNLAEDTYYAPSPEGKCPTPPCSIEGQLRDTSGNCSCPIGTKLIFLNSRLVCRSIQCRNDQMLIPVLDICACESGMILVSDRCVPKCLEVEYRNPENLICACREGLMRDYTDGKCKPKCPNKGEIYDNGKCVCPDELELSLNIKKCVPRCSKEMIRDHTTGDCKCSQGYFMDEKNSTCVQACSSYNRGKDATDCRCGPGMERMDRRMVCVPKCSKLMVRDILTGSCTCAMGYGFNDDKSLCLPFCKRGGAFEKNKCVCGPGYESSVRTSECLPMCKEGMIRDKQSGSCVCQFGYSLWNGKCEEDCKLNFSERIQSGKDGCRCKEGYAYSWSSGECIKACRSNERYDVGSQKCQCPPFYVRKNGICRQSPSKLFRRRSWTRTEDLPYKRGRSNYGRS